jgi:N-acetyl-beta-hexosaminidase
VILAHASHLYLDHPSEADEEEPGLFWATRSSSPRNVFNYMVPVGNHFEDVTPFVHAELRRTYRISLPFNLTAPANIIGQ